MPRMDRDLAAMTARAALVLALAVGWISGAMSVAAMPTEPAPTVVRSKVVALGDSLTAGLGIAPSQAYPAVLQQYIDEARLNYDVVNAGVSGDTSAGGLSRLDW